MLSSRIQRSLFFSGPGDKPEDFNGKNQVATRIVYG